MALSLHEGARLRVELKIWEKAFREEHGRAPAKTDILDYPDIAEMYKTYSRYKAPLSESNRADNPSHASSRKDIAETKPMGAKSPSPLPPADWGDAKVTTTTRSSALQVTSDASATAASHTTTDPPSRLQSFTARASFSPEQRTQQRSPVKRIANLDLSRHASPRSKARWWLGGSRLGDSNVASTHAADPEVATTHADLSPVKAGPTGKYFKPLFDDQDTLHSSAAQSEGFLSKRDAAVRDKPLLRTTSVRKTVKRSSRDVSETGVSRPQKRAKASEPDGGQREGPNPWMHASALVAENTTSTIGHAEQAAAINRPFGDSDTEKEPPASRRRRNTATSDDDMSDIGESLHLRRREPTPVDFPATRVEVDVFEDRHVKLVEALNLNTSPARKITQAIAARKNRIFAQVLGEPQVQAEVRMRHARGLEELAALYENGIGGSDAEADAEGSDDDWASECEGWKELGGHELDGLDDAM